MQVSKQFADKTRQMIDESDARKIAALQAENELLRDALKRSEWQVLDGEWHHVAPIYSDENGWRLYVNGVLVAKQALEDRRKA